MLVLNRRQGQIIDIGPDIQIHVVELMRGQVRIGIVAPKEVSVMRRELIEERKKYEQSNIPKTNPPTENGNAIDQ